MAKSKFLESVESFGISLLPDSLQKGIKRNQGMSKGTKNVDKNTTKKAIPRKANTAFDNNVTKPVVTKPKSTTTTSVPRWQDEYKKIKKLHK